MSDIREQLGHQIRDLRQSKGLTQAQLGNKLGVGRTTVNRYEAGDQNLTVDTIQKIANALQVKFIVILD